MELSPDDGLDAGFWHGCRARSSSADSSVARHTWISLLASDIELFDDFLDSRTGFEVFKHGRDRHSRIAKYQAPFKRPGTLSTAGHFDQSRPAITDVLSHTASIIY